MQKGIFAICFLICLLAGMRGMTQTPGDVTVEFHSSDPQLDSGFAWAIRQAMMYVHRENDPVGYWYEAALPQRDAFCMRDVSHQLIGANILGLADINRNMLTKFVQSISDSRDWCGYWEIDKFNRPAPVDYKSDTDFWYNLPANFDLINACYRQYSWTGETYLLDDSFTQFYHHSLHDYVKRWDKDHDGIMEGTLNKPAYRGIGSYNEGEDGGIIGSDLIGAQYTGNMSYAQLMASQSDKTTGKPYVTEAKKLQSQFLNKWWSKKENSYHQFLKKDGTWINNDPMHLFLLRWDFLPRDAASYLVDKLSKNPDAFNVEMLSYFPLEAFRYGTGEIGTQILKQLTSPSLQRREYPEVSFGALEAYAVGLMGIQPRAATRTVRTVSRLSSGTSEAFINHMPLFDRSVSVRHLGDRKSILTNHSSRAITWEACFYSHEPYIRINGITRKGFLTEDFNGRKMVLYRVVVQGGETVGVQLP